jgi:hypothetical protein
VAGCGQVACTAPPGEDNRRTVGVALEVADVVVGALLVGWAVALGEAGPAAAGGDGRVAGAPGDFVASAASADDSDDEDGDVGPAAGPAEDAAGRTTAGAPTAGELPELS